MVDISPIKHAPNVAYTFMRSYKQLNKFRSVDYLAIKLLYRASYLSPGESIPLELLFDTIELKITHRWINYIIHHLRSILLPGTAPSVS